MLTAFNKKIIAVGFSILAIAIIIGIASKSPTPVSAATGLQCVASTNTLIATTSKNYGNCFSTSTSLFLTPGAGTSTLSFYSQNIDQVGLNIAFAASSSLSRLNWRREVSSNGNDWYSVGDLVTNAPATSTNVTADFMEYSWLFASSTAGTSIASTTVSGFVAVPVSQAFKHVDVYNLQSPYTRFVFYVPAGSTNGAINVHILGKVINPI